MAPQIFRLTRFLKRFAVYSRFALNSNHIRSAMNCVVECNGIIKSVSDKKKYKYLKLENGFQALLISDPKLTEKSSEVTKFRELRNGSRKNSVDSDSSEDQNNSKMSAACLCVRVGTFEDPESIPGLAHLLEHAITMGSKSYPKENIFDDFLSSCGGYSNANTEYEETFFEFETMNEKFEEALRIFASFFVSPLLKKSSVVKETKPVDSEFVEALSDDSCRVELLLQSFVKDGHPLKKFSWGNKETLVDIPSKKNINVQKALIEFWKKHYVAENMALVVQTEDNLETLSQWVTEAFKSVPTKKSKSSQRAPPSGSPFGTQFSKLYYVKPIQKANSLSICWWVPCTRSFYETKPLSHLGSIVGHEGKGSLLSFLRNEHLALEIVAGNGGESFEHNIYQSLFSIAIKLTDKGLAMIGVVVNYVFAFIEMLQEKGPQKYLFDEEMLIEWNHFRFTENISSSTVTKDLASRFFHCPIEHIVTEHLPKTFDEKVINDCLEHLKRSEANIMVINENTFQDCENAVQKEKWTGTEYKCCEIPDEWMVTQDPNVVFAGKVYFPTPNNFIATDFSLFTSENTEPYPSAIYQNECSRLWYKGDNKFNRPKACIYFIFTPAISMDIEKTVALDLFSDILMQNLKDDVYPAYSAGLDHTISFTADKQLLLQVSGFNHKLPNLIDLIVDRIVNFTVDEKVFETMKEDIVKSYFNFFVDSRALTKSLRHLILQQNYYTAFEKLKYVANLNITTLMDAVRLFFGSLFTECLIQGNITPKDAEEILKRVVSTLNTPTAFSLNYPQINEVPKGEHILRVQSFNDEDRFSVITNYYQIGPCDLRQFCLLELLSKAMEEPLFDTLRTGEGLGYDVCNGSLDSWGIGGFDITVVFPTAKFNCDHVNERIEVFLKEFSKKIENMDEIFFEKLVRSRIHAKSIPDLHLKEECDRNFLEIVTRNYCFDRLSREIACLKEISLKEFQRWSLHHILQFPTRRKLSIQIRGNEKSKNDETKKSGSEKERVYDLHFLYNENNERFITNISTFRESLKLFPATFVKN